MVLLSDDQIQAWAEKFVNPANVPFNLNDGLEEVAKAQLAAVVAWGEEPCLHGPNRVTEALAVKTHYYGAPLRRNCDKCWVELRKEAGL